MVAERRFAKSAHSPLESAADSVIKYSVDPAVTPTVGGVPVVTTARITYPTSAQVAWHRISAKRAKQGTADNAPIASSGAMTAIVWLVKVVKSRVRMGRNIVASRVKRRRQRMIYGHTRVCCECCVCCVEYRYRSLS
jgi:hypothetical protein